MPRIPPLLKERARELRNNPTEAERLIWSRVSWHRPAFTRQLVIGRYIVDLACRQVKLAVELDGSQHIDSAYDPRRTAFLERIGWRVLRFWNSDVLTNHDGVARVILNSAGELLEPTHPRPLPSREGRRIRQPRRGSCATDESAPH